VISPERFPVATPLEPSVPNNVEADKDGSVKEPEIVAVPDTVKVPEIVPPDNCRKFKMTFSPLDVTTAC